jgi:hypothetical protein
MDQSDMDSPSPVKTKSHDVLVAGKQHHQGLAEKEAKILHGKYHD